MRHIRKQVKQRIFDNLLILGIAEISKETNDMTAELLSSGDALYLVFFLLFTH